MTNLTRYLVLHFDAESGDVQVWDETYNTLKEAKDAVEDLDESYENDRFTILKQSETGEISILEEAIVPPSELVWKKRST